MIFFPISFWFYVPVCILDSVFNHYSVPFRSVPFRSVLNNYPKLSPLDMLKGVVQASNPRPGHTKTQRIVPAASSRMLRRPLGIGLFFFKYWNESRVPDHGIIGSIDNIGRWYGMQEETGVPRGDHQSNSQESNPSSSNHYGYRTAMGHIHKCLESEFQTPTHKREL